MLLPESDKKYTSCLRVCWCWCCRRFCYYYYHYFFFPIKVEIHEHFHFNFAIEYEKEERDHVTSVFISNGVEINLWAVSMRRHLHKEIQNDKKKNCYFCCHIFFFFFEIMLLLLCPSLCLECCIPKAVKIKELHATFADTGKTHKSGWMFCYATTCQNIVSRSAYFIQTNSFFSPTVTVTITVSVLRFLFQSAYYCNYFDSIAEKIRSIKKKKIWFFG